MRGIHNNIIQPGRACYARLLRSVGLNRRLNSPLARGTPYAKLHSSLCAHFYASAHRYAAPALLYLLHPVVTQPTALQPKINVTRDGRNANHSQFDFI